MSKQAKKREIKYYKIENCKLHNKLYELQYILDIKYNACDQLIKENKKLKFENEKLKNKGFFKKVQRLLGA